MRLAAGIDVGNSTTEVVLVRLPDRRAGGIEIVAAARAPTRRGRGSPQSLDGAAALVRRLERRHGVRVDVAAAALLRPVETLTAALPEPSEATGRIRVVTAGASTAGGRGTGVGRPVRLGTDPPRAGAGDGEPLVAVVPAGTGYRQAATELAALASTGRLAVRSARAVPDGMDEVHGVRAPGTALPGVIMVGTWRSSAGTTFAVCHGRRPAIMIELTGQPFDRLVVTVDDPEEAAAALSAKPTTG